MKRVGVYIPHCTRIQGIADTYTTTGMKHYNSISHYCDWCLEGVQLCHVWC